MSAHFKTASAIGKGRDACCLTRNIMVCPPLPSPVAACARKPASVSLPVTSTDVRKPIVAAMTVAAAAGSAWPSEPAGVNVAVTV